MREPAYAGMFYPGTVNALNRALEACYAHELGPGALPVKPRKDALQVKGIIAPHAGYVYSGMAAAWSYKALAEAPLPDVFVMLGPNHQSNCSGISVQTFKTPLGLVRVDQELAREVKSQGSIGVDESIHAQEHSLEVQLPFLQFSLKSRAEKIKILPLLVSDDLDLDRASHDLKEALGKLRKKACFIVSSDFIHYGPNYGFTPFSRSSDYSEYSEGSGRSEQNPGLVEEKIKKIRELDMKAIDYIKQVDAHGFLNYIRETGATICGFLAIALFLKTVGFNRPVLEQYYTSGDVTGDYTNNVSYASLVFR